MSLVLAVRGEHHVVVASDSIVTTGPHNTEQFGPAYSKVFSLEPNLAYAIGLAGSTIGKNILQPEDKGGFVPTIARYFERAEQKYREKSYRCEVRYLFCGVDNGEPLIYEASLSHAGEDGVQATLPTRCQDAVCAIGKPEYAHVLSKMFYKDHAPLNELIFQAYFTVHVAIKNEPLVRGPIELTIVTENEPARKLDADEIGKLERASVQAASRVKDELLANSPRIV